MGPGARVHLLLTGLEGSPLWCLLLLYSVSVLPGTGRGGRGYADGALLLLYLVMQP